MKNIVPGILFIYRHSFQKNADTVLEHVNAFVQNSRYKIWYVNSETGFPKNLMKLKFGAIVMHYSLFGSLPFGMQGAFLRYLEHCYESYKIAFFQDEYTSCLERFSFINQYKIDCVFTLVEPQYFNDTYSKYTNVPKLIYNIPGYVSDVLINKAQQMTIPDELRAIDVGYRARPLPFYMGIGSQEKTEIAKRFKVMAKGLGLKLDIETQEHKRIYGEKWYRFISNCRGVLGVESGVSIFDVDNSVYEGYQRLIAENPRISFIEMSKRLNFQKWEGKIPYRTISPRNFEAAAFRVCQILFEGEYSGILKPMVHFIPLKKDYTNFEEVICMFKDISLRQKLTENAYRDLIESGKYSYREFIQKKLEPILLEAGLKPEIDETKVREVTSLLEEDSYRRWLLGMIKGALLSLPQPIRKYLAKFYRKFINELPF
jgi:hypothetical protein